MVSSTADGVKLGIADDSNDGSVLGALLGSVNGLPIGGADGSDDGSVLGALLGLVNRHPIGGADGSDDGAADVDEIKLGCALW